MNIRYIKLGDGGWWEKSCIEEDNTLRLGYESPLHDACLKGDWDSVRSFWLGVRKGHDGAATRDVNQIKAFYELSELDIWITFYKRKLYWCNAYKEVIQLEDGSRIRKVIGAWCNKDKNGLPLSIENIDGRVTKVQGFRGTICEVELSDYLLRKINGEDQPDVLAAKTSLKTLQHNIESLIKGLWWNDFEFLVDMIFSKSGWQKISVLGKTQKDIDLDVLSPVTQKRAFIQIKSSTKAEDIKTYYEYFLQYDQYNEMYFIFHTFYGNINEIPIIDDSRVHIWDVSRVAELVIHAGLIDWLITKRT